MREWAYALEYASSEARRKALPHALNHYNERRTHSDMSAAPTQRSGTSLRSPAFGT
jgi:hypothetical protein